MSRVVSFGKSTNILLATLTDTIDELKNLGYFNEKQQVFLIKTAFKCDDALDVIACFKVVEPKQFDVKTGARSHSGAPTQIITPIGIVNLEAVTPTQSCQSLRTKGLGLTLSNIPKANSDSIAVNITSSLFAEKCKQHRIKPGSSLPSVATSNHKLKDEIPTTNTELPIQTDFEFMANGIAKSAVLMDVKPIQYEDIALYIVEDDNTLPSAVDACNAEVVSEVQPLDKQEKSMDDHLPVHETNKKLPITPIASNPADSPWVVMKPASDTEHHHILHQSDQTVFSINTKNVINTVAGKGKSIEHISNSAAGAMKPSVNDKTCQSIDHTSDVVTDCIKADDGGLGVEKEKHLNAIYTTASSPTKFPAPNQASKSIQATSPNRSHPSKFVSNSPQPESSTRYMPSKPSPTSFRSQGSPGQPPSIASSRDSSPSLNAWQNWDARKADKELAQEILRQGAAMPKVDLSTLVFNETYRPVAVVDGVRVKDASPIRRIIQRVDANAENSAVDIVAKQELSAASGAAISDPEVTSQETFVMDCLDVAHSKASESFILQGQELFTVHGSLSSKFVKGSDACIASQMNTNMAEARSSRPESPAQNSSDKYAVSNGNHASGDENTVAKSCKPEKYFGQVVFHKDGDILGASAPPLGPDNKGFVMMEKCGWEKGTGLGGQNKGTLAPLPQSIKNSRAGLGMDMNAPSIPTPPYTGPKQAWDTLERNETPANILTESKKTRHIRQANQGTFQNADALATKTENVPNLEKRTPKSHAMVVRFVAEGPKTGSKSIVLNARVQDRNFERGEYYTTRHYPGVVIMACDFQFGTNQISRGRTPHLRVEKGDHLQIQESRGSGYYLVKQLFDQGLEGLVKVHCVDMKFEIAQGSMAIDSDDDANSDKSGSKRRAKYELKSKPGPPQPSAPKHSKFETKIDNRSWGRGQAKAKSAENKFSKPENNSDIKDERIDKGKIPKANNVDDMVESKAESKYSCESLATGGRSPGYVAPHMVVMDI